ncbi:MAG: DegV family protein [Candidatus Heimdallarchaeota archaeon]|nr:DegV family protein [Candidatus Heimdallarchaeota archaeon]MCK4877572.1 DegV family protein [Candidatus Heimdallarchaeota archaeon]
MRIKIITDSTSNLTPEHAAKYNIDIIPANVVLDGEEILDDGTLHPLEYYDKIDRSKRSYTSVPSPQIICEVFERNKDYDHLLIINVSEKLSGFFSASSTTAKQYKKENPEGPEITVYDSKGASILLGTIAIKAAQLAKKGFSVKKIIKALDKFRDDDVRVWMTVSNLKKLYEGGRISRLRYLLADIIHAYPIFSLIDGQLELVSKDIGLERTVKKIISHIQDFYNKNDKVFLWVGKTKPRDSQELVLNLIEEIAAPKIIGMEEFYVGSIISCHTGSGVYGIISARNFNLD